MCHDSPTCDGELGKGYLTHTGTREILARFLFTALQPGDLSFLIAVVVVVIVVVVVVVSSSSFWGWRGGARGVCGCVGRKQRR